MPRNESGGEKGEQSRGGNKPKGWFSRRHSTGQEHDKAATAYKAEHGPEARQRKADERDQLRATRSPEEQLAVLDQRLGVGQGARRERARLQALIKTQS